MIIINKILSIPRSMYYCIRLFGVWGGVRLPIIFSNNTKIHGVRRGKVLILQKRMRIQFGFGGSDGICTEESIFYLGSEGRIIFEGNARFAEGCRIRVDSGILHFGSNFSANKNCFISCTQAITIGSNTAFGWNVNVRDTDGHTMYYDGVKKNNMSPVVIGNHVWIAAYVDILKGVSIPDGCVVAYRSCVINTIGEKNSLVAGFPAVIKRNNIGWDS